MDGRKRLWGGTVFCESFDDIAGIYNEGTVEWFKGGMEKCPTTGKSHVHFVVRFKNARQFNGLHKKWKDVHWEMEYPGQAWERYLGKDNNIFEKGTPPNPGARHDIRDIKTRVLEGESVGTILEAGAINNIQQLRFAENLQKYKKNKEFSKKTVIWIYGPTGTGKSRSVWESEEDLFVMEPMCEWFDGYDAQEAALLDDFRGTIQLNVLLRLLDGYDMIVKIKGGFVKWNPKRIYITSCKRPEELYINAVDKDEKIEQLLRRITEIRCTNTEVGL